MKYSNSHCILPDDLAAYRVALSSRKARLERAKKPHRVSLSSYLEPTMPTIVEESDDVYENEFKFDHDKWTFPTRRPMVS